jgi:hypothetical protein
MSASLDLALIGNCTVGALLDGRGRLVWGCFPRFDGDPVFCSLLDDTLDYGFFDIELIDFEKAEQTYLSRTPRSCARASTTRAAAASRSPISHRASASTAACSAP